MHDVHFPMPISGGEVHQLQRSEYIIIFEEELDNANKMRAHKIMTYNVKARREITSSRLDEITAEETQMPSMFMVTVTGCPAITHAPTKNNLYIEGFVS